MAMILLPDMGPNAGLVDAQKKDDCSPIHMVNPRQLPVSPPFINEDNTHSTPLTSLVHLGARGPPSVMPVTFFCQTYLCLIKARSDRFCVPDKIQHILSHVEDPNAVG